MTWKALAATTIPALALALVAPGAARAENLVTNGSFEQLNSGQTFTGKSNFHDAGVTGWSGGTNLTFLDAPGTADNGSYLSVYGPFPKTSPDGGNFVEADGAPSYSAAIYQTINGLTKGQLYAVSFYQAAGQQAGFTGPTTEQWNVSLGSETHSSSQYSLPQGGVGAWEAQTLVFTATGASEVLSFLAVGTPNGEPPISFLDGVSLSAVPEPSSLVLTAFSVVGLGVVGLRRRAAKSAASA